MLRQAQLHLLLQEAVQFAGELLHDSRIFPVVHDWSVAGITTEAARVDEPLCLCGKTNQAEHTEEDDFVRQKDRVTWLGNAVNMLN